MNNLAQIVEVIHEIEESLEIISQLLETGIQEENIIIEPRASHGIGVVEAPRGLLIHDYTYNSQGYIAKANCIIPTNMNHANIQRDLETMVSENVNHSPGELRRLCEMLVRSYDPCISCSTH